MLIFNLIANNLQAQTIPTGVKYISEVKIFAANIKSNALNDIEKAGYEVVGYNLNDGNGIHPVDLNDKAGGKFIFLGVKYTNNCKEAITDLVCTTEEKNIKTLLAFNSGVYTPVESSNDVYDLNAGAGGKRIYLYCTYNGNYNPSKCITHLWIYQDFEDYLNKGRVHPHPDAVLAYHDYGQEDKACDLNDGCGVDSEYIYLMKQRDVCSIEIDDGIEKTYMYGVKGQDVKILIPDRKDSHCMYPYLMEGRTNFNVRAYGQSPVYYPNIDIMADSCWPEDANHLFDQYRS